MVWKFYKFMKILQIFKIIFEKLYYILRFLTNFKKFKGFARVWKF